MKAADPAPATVRAVLPPPADIGRLRRLLLAELYVFALIPVFAAAMARGFGHTAG